MAPFIHKSNSMRSYRFSVRFSEETFKMSDLCIFKIQYDISSSYEIYLQINLYHQKKESKLGNIQNKENVPKKVDTNTICISHKPINHFQRTIFTAPMFFGHLDFYILSADHGYKIRNHSLQLLQFSTLSDQKVNDLKSNRQNMHLTTSRCGNIIKKHFKLNSFYQFYQKTLKRSVQEWQRLRKIYLYFQSAEQLSLDNILANKYVDFRYILIQNIRDLNLQHLLYYYEAEEENQLYYNVLQQANQVCQNIRYMFDKFITKLLELKLETFQQLLKESLQIQKKNKLQAFLVYKKVKDKIKYTKKNFIDTRRSYLQQLSLYNEKDKHFPLLCLQLEERSKKLKIQQTSLVVLVHGFQGSSADMEKIKNYLTLQTSSCKFLLIDSIRNSPNDGIKELGQRIYQQVEQHINSSYLEYQRINFIGFSLGGVLIRAAITHMTKYKHKLNLLITFGSPHLGISFGCNKIVQAGLWFMQKMEKIKNIEELTLEKQSAQQSVMTSLSKSQSLSWFRKVVVVGSRDDQFIPHFSAKIQQEDIDNQISVMSMNIRNRIIKLERIQVWFDASHITSTFDKILGRKSHIQFLDNDLFAQTISQIYGPQL